MFVALCERAVLFVRIIRMLGSNKIKTIQLTCDIDIGIDESELQVNLQVLHAYDR